MYTTKTTLINKLAAGSEVGWQEFENVYRNLLQTVAVKQGIPSADVDDIIQLVMVGLFNNGKFNYSRERHGKFRTYLGGILRHKIADYFRKNDVQTKTDLSTAEEYQLPEFEKVYLAEYRQYMLNAAIEEMKEKVSPEYIETFQLCILQELPDKKVAEMLGEKPNTITVRKKRCKEILQRIISEMNHDDQEMDLTSL